ncbi:MAG: hypothetical protein OXE98_02470 [Hyphomicrobiales bacterium]|nr:hypothetical protein [Hyphomicrobiales bacterium]
MLAIDFEKPVEKSPDRILLDNAGALFELVCFGVFTNLDGLLTMPFRSRIQTVFKFSFAVGQGTCSLPAENGRFSGMEKLPESTVILRITPDFYRKSSKFGGRSKV